MNRLFLFLVIALFIAVDVAAQRKVDATHEFAVTGSVEKNTIITIADIKKRSATDLGDMTVKNHKGEQKKTAKAVKGVLLTAVLADVQVKVEKPRQYSELVLVLTASDGYKNVYSWNELFNTEVGKHVYVITAMDGETMDNMPDAIIVVSTADINAGARYFKGLQKIEIKQVD